jgi:DNA-binding transcriptional LysR family regulator
MNTKRDRADALSMQQVYTFCLVYEAGGYAEGAEVMGLSAPTLWEQVKALERIYGTTLFQKVGRGVEPTESAHRLYDMLSPMRATVESTFEVLSVETDQQPKQVRLVTGVRMMLEELGVGLARYHKSYPGVSLRLMAADNQASQELLLQDKADIALFIEPPAGLIQRGVIVERLYPIDHLAVFPKRHPLQKKSQCSIRDLVKEPLVVGHANTVGRKLLEHAWFRLGMKSPMNIVAETDNSAITIACVRANMGIGIIAGIQQGHLTKTFETRSLSAELGTVNVVAAMRKGRILTQHAKALLSILRQLHEQS